MSSRPAFTPGAMLVGRRAVVTGGAAGIGAAVARSFAAHGAHVLVADVDPVGDLDYDAAAGGSLVSVRCDVRDASAHGPLVAHRPDILVNNVGHYLRAPHCFAANSPDLWHDLHEVNLGHALRLTHAVLPGMTDRGGGSIVNLTTVEAHRAMPGHTVYSAYKSALMQFTRSLSAEVGPAGIRVNAVAPDLIESVQVPYDELVPTEQRALWPNWSPLGGPGQPEDVAGAALFLASDLSRFVTGSTIHVDGGWTNRPLNP